MHGYAGKPLDVPQELYKTCLNKYSFHLETAKSQATVKEGACLQEEAALLPVSMQYKDSKEFNCCCHLIQDLKSNDSKISAGKGCLPVVSLQQTGSRVW